MSPFARTLAQAVIGIAVILILWAVAAPLAIARGVSSFMAPSPVQVMSKIVELIVTDSFQQHLRASIATFVQGIVPALIAGLLIGLAIRSSKTLRWLLGPLTVAVAAAPVIGLAPLFILWFGFAPASKLTLIFLMAAFPLAATVMIEEARAAVAIVAGLRIAIALGVMALLISEFIGSKSGIGNFMADAAAQLDPTSMLAAFLVIALPTILLSALLHAIEEQIAG